jgi:hypothetical protein
MRQALAKSERARAERMHSGPASQPIPHTSLLRSPDKVVKYMMQKAD